MNPRSVMHDAALLVALLASLAALVAVVLVEGVEAATGARLGELSTFIAGALAGVSIANRQPPTAGS